MKEYCRDRSRRSVLVATGATMVTLLLPRLASATPAQVETEINKLYAGKTGKPTDNAFIERQEQNISPPRQVRARWPP